MKTLIERLGRLGGAMLFHDGHVATPRALAALSGTQEADSAERQRGAEAPRAVGRPANAAPVVAINPPASPAPR